MATGPHELIQAIISWAVSLILPGKARTNMQEFLVLFSKKEQKEKPFFFEEKKQKTFDLWNAS